MRISSATYRLVGDTPVFSIWAASQLSPQYEVDDDDDDRKENYSPQEVSSPGYD